MISPEEKKAVIDLFPFMGQNPIVFDCGANKAEWSDIVINEFGDNCTVHVFEPNKKLLSFIEIKYEYKNNIIYRPDVVYKKEVGQIPFYYFENFNNELSSLYNGGSRWDGLPVKEGESVAYSLDYYCQHYKINKVDYIKIDVEGADMDVIFGCNKLMQQDIIGIIQIEYSEHWDRANYNFQNLKEIAEKYGYKIYRYIGDNFWEEKSVLPEFDNYFLTKYEIHNYCISGSNDNFVLNTIDLPEMDLVIEVGCMEGITTKYICENLLNKDNPDSRVICIDPLFDYYVKDDPRYHPEFKGQYQRFLRNTRGLPVNLIRGKSQEELPKLNALRANFIYIDGDHYAPMPYLDGVWCFAITKIGGYILFDDYEWCAETKESIDKFLKEFEGAYEIVKSNYQVLIKKTSNRYTDLTYEYYK